LRVTQGFAIVLGFIGLGAWRRAQSVVFARVAELPELPELPAHPTMDEMRARGLAAAARINAYADPVITEPALGWIIATAVGTALVYVLSILAHELGHLVAARRHGVEVTAVDLHAFGGSVEHHDDERLTAGSLAAIAGAGPLVTGVLVLCSGALLLALGRPLTSTADVHSGAELVAGFMLTACLVLNTVCLVVNLLPFRGLDGGHLRTAVAMWRGRR
jgi:Zn-dependent protease